MNSLADPVQSDQVNLCHQFSSIPREEDRAIVEIIKSCCVCEATKMPFQNDPFYFLQHPCFSLWESVCCTLSKPHSKETIVLLNCKVSTRNSEIFNPIAKCALFLYNTSCTLSKKACFVHRSSLEMCKKCYFSSFRILGIISNSCFPIG